MWISFAFRAVLAVMTGIPAVCVGCILLYCLWYVMYLLIHWYLPRDVFIAMLPKCVQIRFQIRWLCASTVIFRVFIEDRLPYIPALYCYTSSININHRMKMVRAVDNRWFSTSAFFRRRGVEWNGRLVLRRNFLTWNCFQNWWEISKIGRAKYNLATEFQSGNESNLVLSAWSANIEVKLPLQNKNPNIRIIS